MKKQADIKIEEIYPSYATQKHKAYKRQEEHIFKLHSRPLRCPCCNEMHTVNELITNLPEFGTPEYQEHGAQHDLRCPKTNEQLVHQMGLVAGIEALERKSTEPLYPDKS
jgi:hypothetical protein